MLCEVELRRLVDLSDEHKWIADFFVQWDNKLDLFICELLVPIKQVVWSREIVNFCSVFYFVSRFKKNTNTEKSWYIYSEDRALLR